MRSAMLLNTGWLYSPQDIPEARQPDFADSAFEAVCLPHANKILEKHKGPDFQAQIESYRFVSWYRKHFALPEDYTPGKRVLVEFEGVATVAEVYVNGIAVGCHRGAYTGFTCDITEALNTAGDNVLAVRVDATRHPDIPPEGNRVDYCLFGGIVRNVHLIVTGGVHMENTFLTTPELAENEGRASRLSAVTRVVNKSGAPHPCAVEISLLDAEGCVVTEAVSEPCTLQPGEARELSAVAPVIEAPHLWNGLDDPYLYTVTTRVKCGATVTDDCTTPIGFRWFEFRHTPEDGGFRLNGRKVKLFGVNRHEQWPWIGRAVADRHQIADADLIADTGFNIVRCSHYPQSPAFLRRCDELGLMVFEEAPGWQHIGDAAWQTLYCTNVEEMILRDRNHPAIISWGTRVNESDDDRALYLRSNDLAHRLDPTRPTHGVRRCDGYESDHPSKFLDNEDIFVANYVYPDKPRVMPFVVGEHSWDCWFNGYGCPGASDEQALAFARDFADKVNYYMGNPLCAGGFAWSMFDYDNEVNYTNTNNVFYSGLYDIFRLPKPVAYAYRAQKPPVGADAMVYIANDWDDDEKPIRLNSVTTDIAQGGTASADGIRRGDTFDIVVMSNCDAVQLFINGIRLDRTPRREYLNLPHPFFVFEDVPFTPGEICAVGYIGGEERARHIQRTPGVPVRLALCPDDAQITADGADFTRITVTARDANGTWVPRATNEVHIEVEGEGCFIGEQDIALEGGRTAFFVQSRYGKTGPVCCTVSAAGMEAAVCTVEVRA